MTSVTMTSGANISMGGKGGSQEQGDNRGDGNQTGGDWGSEHQQVGKLVAQDKDGGDLEGLHERTDIDDALTVRRGRRRSP